MLNKRIRESIELLNKGGIIMTLEQLLIQIEGFIGGVKTLVAKNAELEAKNAELEAHAELNLDKAQSIVEQLTELLK